jgi:hypothetical protein
MYKAMGLGGTGLTHWTYYDMEADVIPQKCETYHDKPDIRYKVKK